jgi:hypothetical protein
MRAMKTHAIKSVCNLNACNVTTTLKDIYSFGNPVSLGNAAMVKSTNSCSTHPLFHFDHLVIKGPVHYLGSHPF